VELNEVIPMDTKEPQKIIRKGRENCIECIKGRFKFFLCISGLEMSIISKLGYLC